jgi:3-oxoacyl-[acyl-carrier protein] reductase
MARNEEALKKVKGELNTEKGQQHSYLVADFSNHSEVSEILSLYLSRQGNINIVVNNTGGPRAGLLTQAKPIEFLDAFQQHLVCNHLIAQACIEGMKRSGYGRIINIISTSVKQPLKGLGVSNTIRAAVANWSKTLANELGPFGITVNNVLPGATQTSRLNEIIQNKSLKQNMETSAVQEEMLHEIPAGRFADATEIAYAVAFLSSPSAAYINGINLPVDGGRTSCL